MITVLHIQQRESLLEGLLPAPASASHVVLDHEHLDIDAVLPQLCVKSPVHLIGFSRGARLALELAPTIPCSSVFAVGFPFFDRENQEPLGLPLLESAPEIPVTIVQGTRDPYGTYSHCKKLVLPSWVEVHWIDDGNHRLHRRGVAQDPSIELRRCYALHEQRCRRASPPELLVASK